MKSPLVTLNLPSNDLKAILAAKGASEDVEVAAILNCIVFSLIHNCPRVIMIKRVNTTSQIRSRIFDFKLIAAAAARSDHNASERKKITRRRGKRTRKGI